MLMSSADGAGSRIVRATLLTLSLAMIAIAGARHVHAQQLPPRRVALVIGNGGYRNVDRLGNPANDARLVASTLRSAGFTLVGDGPQIDLDKSRFDRLVQAFGKALQGADVALFYYSGHGMQVQGVNWLVPVDANPSSTRDLDFQMVDASLVLRQMEGSGTKLNLLLLDACRNNPFASHGIRATGGGLAEMRAPEGTLISYATQPGNVAADGSGADSPYTAALVDAIRQPGLDVFRVFNQVGLTVKQSTGGEQQPWLASSPIAGNFYFFNGPVTIVAPASPTQPSPALPAAPPVSANLGTRRFDGLWDVVLNCPSEGVAMGYTFRFVAQVSNGSLHGQHGVASEPASLTLDGTLHDDGSGLLNANGRTNRIEQNVQAFKTAKPGTPYFYNVEVHFDGNHGTGSRLGGVRTCNYTFTKR